jgi:hypothetical protein
MDSHLHFVLGTDSPLARGAAQQWRDYIGGGDGIGGNDYEARPDPLVLTPPEGDDMPRYTEWPTEDRKALATDVATAVWGFVVDGGKLTARHVMERLGKAFDRNGNPK